MGTNKIIYVMRGGPGSGKSFLAAQLVDNGQIFSTDSYWHLNKEGTYQFNINKLRIAHEWNKRRIKKAVEVGISPIVIDNTNTTLRELRNFKNIIIEAKEKGYRIEIKEPMTSWRFDIEELMKRNTHNVPREALEAMLKRYQKDLTVDDILND